MILNLSTQSILVDTIIINEPILDLIPEKATTLLYCQLIWYRLRQKDDEKDDEDD